MSRHTITVKTTRQTDEEAVIGYDPPLRSCFLTAFRNEETDESALWLSGFLEGYPSLEAIIEAARADGYEVSNLSHDAIVSNERSRIPTPPSVGERLGLVR